LAFREIEPLQTLIRRQVEQQPECTPRVILVDGNGILHPRRAGIACFLGVRTGIPTIGIGKKLCCAEDCWTVSETESAIALGLRDAGMALAETRKVPSNGLILDTKGVSFVETDSGPDTCEDVPCIKDSVAAVLAGKRKGYATYLRASNGTVLGAALVGHGGKAHGALCGKQTSNPIYISVGHNISLEEAIVVCEELSDVRIQSPSALQREYRWIVAFIFVPQNTAEIFYYELFRSTLFNTTASKIVFCTSS
jgi:deoxyinosine 3'endonuclease (endonuclease V)